MTAIDPRPPSATTSPLPPAPAAPRRPAPVLRVSGTRLEPWRDAVLIGVANHAVLLVAAVLQPGYPLTVLLGVVLGVGLATGTLTVLHDAGHRMFARSAWPNVLAVQTTVPAGLWVGQWTLKHRVHHKLSQVYPVDESTRSSRFLRLHREAPLLPVHRHQHVYAWFLYGLAWVGEIKSQLTYLVTGVVTGTTTPSAARRTGSFLVEKALWVLVLAPYAARAGVGHVVVMLVVAMTVGSLIAAVVLTVGHINLGLVAEPGPPGREWAAHLVRTTASFSTRGRLARWGTGGMTHHLAHHLRPAALRSQLPVLHDTVVQQVVADSGVPLSEYPTLASAVRAHYRRLQELGAPAPL
ncbi:MAG: linoleoyl-CoA desaturase [Frankiales bacterium]|nr:linoleoyl-CoA desaturase [Frankiales bacterium]